MAFPAIHSKPTPKRVAAYLIEAMIGTGLGQEIDAMEAAFDATLTDAQRKEVIRHFDAYQTRVLALVDRKFS